MLETCGDIVQTNIKKLSRWFYRFFEVEVVLQKNHAGLPRVRLGGNTVAALLLFSSLYFKTLFGHGLYIFFSRTIFNHCSLQLNSHLYLCIGGEADAFL